MIEGKGKEMIAKKERHYMECFDMTAVLSFTTISRMMHSTCVMRRKGEEEKQNVCRYFFEHEDEDEDEDDAWLVLAD